MEEKKGCFIDIQIVCPGCTSIQKPKPFILTLATLTNCVWRPSHQTINNPYTSLRHSFKRGKTRLMQMRECQQSDQNLGSHAVLYCGTHAVCAWASGAANEGVYIFTRDLKGGTKPHDVELTNTC